MLSKLYGIQGEKFEHCMIHIERRYRPSVAIMNLQHLHLLSIVTCLPETYFDPLERR